MSSRVLEYHAENSVATAVKARASMRPASGHNLGIIPKTADVTGSLHIEITPTISRIAMQTGTHGAKLTVATQQRRNSKSSAEVSKTTVLNTRLDIVAHNAGRDNIQNEDHQGSTKFRPTSATPLCTIGHHQDVFGAGLCVAEGIIDSVQISCHLVRVFLVRQRRMRQPDCESGVSNLFSSHVTRHSLFFALLAE